MEAVRRAGIPDATIRSAATVMLVRDAIALEESALQVPALQVPALEVFVMRRTPRAVFGPGATVFPGGAVDESDAQTLAHVLGPDDAAASAELGLTGGGLLRRVAAVRECFEEAGILLARHAASDAPAQPAAEWRDALNAGHATLAQMLARDGLVIDACDLRVFAHWLTPTGAPRRYDTWFFVARAPEGQDGAHDDSELVASEWVRPADAIARHERGDIDLILPTLRSLQALTRFPSVTALFAALDQVPRDERGRLCVVAEASGERVLLPEDDPARAAPWTIPLPDISVRDERRIVAGGGVR